jgi:type II restriction enzyme
MRVTASDLVRAIAHLPRNQVYHYPTKKTRTQIQILNVDLPEGPIYIKRFNPANGETPDGADVESISSNMIWRIANALIPGNPINFDRVFAGSYNTRSALEALLAHTPQFYSCSPGRIEVVASSTEIKRGHKHLVWRPDLPHEEGVMRRIATDVTISEIPSADLVYDSLTLPKANREMDINMQRRHAQIQIALIMIGQQLGFRIWVAQNDKGIIYNDKRLGEMDGVVQTLRNERIIAAYGEAADAAAFIDCIWFRNHRFMPAVLEIEHSTGVTSGLNRMLTFQNALPPIQTRWVIVAPDEDRAKVFEEANLEQFRSMRTQYFSYSAVEEFFSLCKRRRLKGVNDEFLDCFMENCVAA